MLAEFRATLSRFLAFERNGGSREGTRPRRRQALLAIKGFAGREPVTTGQLAERLSIRHHSTVGLVDRLAAKGSFAATSARTIIVKCFLNSRPKRKVCSQGFQWLIEDELKRAAPLLRELLAHFEQSSLPKAGG